MQVGAVTDALGTRLATIAGLRVYDYLAEAVAAPAAVVVLETIDYDATMGRGTDRATYRVHLLVGQAGARPARDALDLYLDGTGERSVKAVLEADPPPAGPGTSARVMSAGISVMGVGGTDYLTATFAVDVIA